MYKINFKIIFFLIAFYIYVIFVNINILHIAILNSVYSYKPIQVGLLIIEIESIIIILKII